ncbi:MAG: MFS transporter [Sulfitobacter sp.]
MTATQTNPIPREKSLFSIVVAGSGAMMATASLPSPFYPVLQQEIGFAPFIMTAIFAIYAIALLATLVILGSISDHIGRRPVLSAGFGLLAVSMFWFDHAQTANALLATRSLQGVACGLLLSTLPAATSDLEPRNSPGLAAVCNAVVPLLGLAGGALISGIAMAYLVGAKQEVFWGATALCLGFAALVWSLPETAPMRPGAWQALRPKIGLPQPVRKAFWRGSPALIAGWATGGLYLSLGALVIKGVFGLESTITQGAVVTLLAGVGAVSGFFARRFNARQVMLFGTAALCIGTLGTLIGIHLASLPLYLIALTIVGAGFGTCFYAFLQSIMPLIPVAVMAETFATVFCFSYLAFGVPVVLAGLIIPHIGLAPTVITYGILVALLAAAAGLLRKFTVAD